MRWTVKQAGGLRYREGLCGLGAELSQGSLADVLVTDDGATEEQVSALRLAGVQVTIA